MHKFRTLLAPALAAAVAGGAFVAVAPGLAYAGSSLCDNGRVCIYDDLNWVGLLGKRSAGNGVLNVSGGANDKMSSWENRTNRNSRWYQDHSAGGFCRTMNARRESGYVGGSDNDELTSWATNGAC